MSMFVSARGLIRMLAGCAGGAAMIAVAAAGPALAGARAASAPAAGTPVVCPVATNKVLFYAPATTGKTVALTFDDGPGKSTAQIIAILQKYKVPATFFNLGANEAAGQAMVLNEANLGYVIGNHTWDHPNMKKLSKAKQATELDLTTAEQIAITGSGPCLFRPPYGNYNATTLLLAQQRSLTTYLWSVDPEDWKAQGSGSAYWVNRIISRVETQSAHQSHPCVLFHNQPVGNPATVKALPVIIKYFMARGYTFVTLS